MPSRAQNLGELGTNVLAGGGLPLTTLSTLTVTDSSYTALSDLAVRPTGGYIKITGYNFVSGCTLYINGSPATSTTFVSATEVRAQLPALAVGTYSLMLFNAASVGAIWASGIIYSAAPVWTSTSYNNPTNVVNTQLLATGDGTLIYTLASGTLPTGVTLSSTGLLSGTVSGVTSTTTFSFTVAVTDAQNQDSPQVISLSLVFYIGKLWLWGNNSSGMLGLGDYVDRSSPVQVGASIKWATVTSGGATMHATDTDGKLWAIGGYNAQGTLGLGDTSGRNSPVQVGALTDWLNVACGTYHVIATKTNGTLWAWGSNTQGELGLGDTTGRSSPVQIGSLTNWLKISAGYRWNIALKTDGTLWFWGDNQWGQQGNGNLTSCSSPVQVGSATTWSKVIAGKKNVLAVTTSGTLWAWGQNYGGALGLGDTVTRSYPIQVGSLTTWLEISGGNYHGLALKTDGTLWSWGFNSHGQQGNGNTTHRSSPGQVGALTTWTKIRAFNYSSTAIKTDGTLWTWGRNDSGQLALGDTTVRSSPVQVGSLTNWQSLGTGPNSGRFQSAISG